MIFNDDSKKEDGSTPDTASELVVGFGRLDGSQSTACVAPESFPCGDLLALCRPCLSASSHPTGKSPTARWRFSYESFPRHSPSALAPQNMTG